MNLCIVIPVYISNELHLDFTRQTLASIRTSHDHNILIVNNFCAPEYTPGLSALNHDPGSSDDPGSSLVTLLDNPAGNILASAWNLGIKEAFNIDGGDAPAMAPTAGPPGFRLGSRGRTLRASSRSASDFCVILNNDLILHPLCLDNLVKFAEKHPEFLLWSATEWANSRTLLKAKMTPSFSPHPHFSCFMVSPKTIKTVGYFDEHFTMGYFEDNDYHTRILQAGFQAAATDTAKFYHYGSRTINVDDALRLEAKYRYQQNRAYFKKKWGVDIHGRAFSPPEEILKEIQTQLSP